MIQGNSAIFVLLNERPEERARAFTRLVESVASTIVEKDADFQSGLARHVFPDGLDEVTLVFADAKIQSRETYAVISAACPFQQLLRSTTD